MSIVKKLILVFTLIKLVEQGLLIYFQRMNGKVKAYIKREKQKYPS